MRIKTSIFSILVSLSFFIGSAQEEENTTPEGSLVVDVHPNITKLVETKFKENYSDTYKIQLFYGVRSSAERTLAKFNSKYSEWSGNIYFETPNYKVWVGNFRTRLEADRALMKISKSFPAAFIFKPKK